MEEDKYINLLLLGESGIGKTTFINSFETYCKYANFEDMCKANFSPLIGVKFPAQTKDGDVKFLQFGEDTNEDNEIGNSSTQEPKSYIFKYGTSMIRLLDTPGIGDSRGVAKDMENFENILNFIGQFKYIHGFCFFMKPNVTVLNSFFEVCLLELLKGLDKFASRNFLYVFTNTRVTDYTAPDTLINLKRLMDKISHLQDVKITIDKSNTFCLDNEGLKYALAKRVGFELGKYKVMQNSWDVSKLVCHNLINHVLTLPPYKVQGALSINEARRLIWELAQPLIDILNLGYDNLYATQVQMELVQKEQWNQREYDRYLCIPEIQIQSIKLKQPMTVCSSPKCTDIQTTGYQKHFVYKSICHNPCRLGTTPTAVIGAKQLKQCRVMRHKKCMICGCSYKLHKHLYYKTILHTNNKKLNYDAKSNMDIRVLRQKMMQNLHEHYTNHKKNLDLLSFMIAKFAYYLETNSLCPENDFIEKYLDDLIQRQQSLSDSELLERYHDMKESHKKLKDYVKKHVNPMTSIDIIQSIDSLYNIPIYGNEIQNLHLQVKLATQAEHLEKLHKVSNATSTPKNTSVNSEKSIDMKVMKNLLDSGKFENGNDKIGNSIGNSSKTSLSEADVRRIVWEELCAFGLIRRKSIDDEEYNSRDHPSRQNIDSYKKKSLYPQLNEDSDDEQAHCSRSTETHSKNNRSNNYMGLVDCYKPKNKSVERKENFSDDEEFYNNKIEPLPKWDEKEMFGDD